MTKKLTAEQHAARIHRLVQHIAAWRERIYQLEFTVHFCWQPVGLIQRLEIAQEADYRMAIAERTYLTSRYNLLLQLLAREEAAYRVAASLPPLTRPTPLLMETPLRRVTPRLAETALSALSR